MEEVWRRTSDERAPASRPPCGDTVAALCGPAACSAAPASPDQGLTVRFRRQSMLETAGAIAAEAWDGQPRRATAGRCLPWGLGGARTVRRLHVRVLTSYGPVRACTDLHHWAVPRGTYREGAERMLVERRAGPSRLDGVQSAGARASCCRREMALLQRTNGTTVGIPLGY